MTLKDPKIVACKMINCVDYINLGPTGKIRSQGIDGSPAAHCWGSWALQTRGHHMWGKSMAAGVPGPLAISVSWGRVNTLTHNSMGEASLPGLCSF